MGFIPQYEPNVRLKDIWAVAKQMYSGWVGPSKAVTAFEEKLSELTEAEAFTTTSGTVALMIALQSLNLPKGSTILFPAYTFLAGANAARFLGYKVKLVDVSYDTLCMNPKRVEYALKNFKSISCVMYVNHNAYMEDDGIRDLCDEYKVKMIEDTSQALGMSSLVSQGNNFNPHLLGDVGVYSFSVPKIITTGQGGVVYTNNQEISDRIMEIRDHGGDWRQSRRHDKLGVNFKFNDILAAYGISQLNDLDKLLAKRKQVFDWYRKHIELIDYGYDSTWMAIYRSTNPDTVIKELRDNSIQAVQYYQPVHFNEPYKVNNSKQLKIAEKLSYELVYLPSSLKLKEKHVKKICKIIQETENRGND